ncbi:TonB-dependent receptor [Muricauda oceani]|uniref:TonB-dependent receptor n=1 Tax=Flagellimonas oceani TaxID=2698672 RepID=A0A6G7J480_9FLAO|nr:TonB-dependent receptor [Allomuricauda oceani]MBW8242785.1 TonB-dependent receptor [Allomuricauda oceani]QII45480.1 TonB-dependent receptor [Allomuricauda oceani]
MVQFTFSQNTSITISGDSKTSSEFFRELEKKSGFSFFYLDNWIENIEVTDNFVEASITEILNIVLSDTSLNFYVLEEENRVFLLQNTVVYDELPPSFYRQNDSITHEREVIARGNFPPPVFYNDHISQTAQNLPVVRIGRADEKNLKSTYKLSGRAVNAQTGAPIPDLAIRVQSSGRVAVTNEQGEYELILPAGYNLIATSAMGIRDSEQEVIMYNDGTLNLQLQESLEQLQEVVVEADAVSNVEDAISGSEEISSEESKDIPLVLGERNILEVAKALPGISSAGEGATGLNVRGGKTDQNLVLLDDAVIYNPTHFFGIFQALNPFTTEKVNIYKGAPPVEFGGRLSSVLNIETKNGDTEKISGEGSIGPVTGNLALEIPLKKKVSSLMIGGRGAYADWILQSLDEESLNNSEASFFDGIVKYHHKFNENSEIRGTAYYSKDNFSITSDSLYNYSNRLGSVRWAHKLSEKTTGVLTASNSNYNFGIDYEDDGNSNFELDYTINESELRYRLNTRLNDMHIFGYGLSAKYYAVEPGNVEPKGANSNVEPVSVDQEQALEGALFIGDEFKVSERLLFNVGARYAFYAAMGEATQNTYQEGAPRSETTVQDTIAYGSGEFIKTYGGPEARVSARYLFAPDFSIKASFNNSYQFIHTLSNNTTVSPIDTWKLSDLNIKPQKGYQVTLGFFKNFKENMYELSLEGYYKRMEDVLDFKTGADLLLNENVETEVLQGQGKAYGVEFLLKKNRGSLNGWVSYTYSRSKYRFDGDTSEERINNGEFFPSNFDKPHDLSVIANYKFTRRYSVSMNFAYQTGRPITYPVGTFRFNNADYVTFSDRNKFRIPDYYRLDLGINIEGNHKKNKLAHSFITIQVYNVLGRNNPYSVFFVTDDGEVKALQSSIFGVPIPSITYNFKF